MNKKKKNQNLVSMLIDNVPRNLRNQFKAACAEQGISMRQKLLLLIKETSDRHQEMSR